MGILNLFLILWEVNQINTRCPLSWANYGMTVTCYHYQWQPDWRVYPNKISVLLINRQGRQKRIRRFSPSDGKTECARGVSDDKQVLLPHAQPVAGFHCQLSDSLIWIVFTCFCHFRQFRQTLKLMESMFVFFLKRAAQVCGEEIRVLILDMKKLEEKPVWSVASTIPIWWL